MKTFGIIVALMVFACCVALAGTDATAQSTLDARANAVITQHGDRGGALDTVGQPLAVISVPVPSSSGVGVSIAADCRGTLYYTNYLEAVLYKMTAAGALLGSVNTVNAAGAAVYIDEMSWDEGRQLLWGGETTTNGIYLIDPSTGMCTFQFAGQSGFDLTDGIAFDATDGTIWHSTDVSGTIAHFTAAGAPLADLTPLDANGNVDGSISGICVGTNNRMYVGHNGQGRISIVNKYTGVWISDFFSPGGRDEGLECDAINFAPSLVLWSKDAYNDQVTAIEVDSGTCVCAQLPDTCEFPWEVMDMGDLPACNYPTLFRNPGHGLSGIAWLGQCVDGEPAPNTLDLDACDDGVFFVGLPWTPCTVENLRVTVTAGPEYGRYENCGGHLYLNAWKDGNLDGDFCDLLDCGVAGASEWIIQDALVTPGVWPFAVLDPGVDDQGVYDGVFRFRLTSQPVGRFGFGLSVAGACNFTCPGTYGFDFLGEVEDYIITDGQLSVELASFSAIGNENSIALNWTTASETSNDHFELLRDNQLLTSVPTQGNSADGHSYRYVDENVTVGTVYLYTLVAVDVNGAREELGSVQASPSAGQSVVTEYALYQNYPNPFNPTTQIAFDLVDGGMVSLKVYNMVGQEVATLVNQTMTSGHHALNFNAAGLPSGIYIYKLTAGDFNATRKMLLMK